MMQEDSGLCYSDPNVNWLHSAVPSVQGIIACHKEFLTPDAGQERLGNDRRYEALGMGWKMQLCCCQICSRCQWELDLNEAIISQTRDTISWLGHKLSLNVRIRHSTHKRKHSWYYTSAHLPKVFPGLPGICWRCNKLLVSGGIVRWLSTSEV